MDRRCRLAGGCRMFCALAYTPPAAVFRYELFIVGKPTPSRAIVQSARHAYQLIGSGAQG